MAVTNVGLVVHGGRAEAAQAAGAVRQWCAGNGVRCTDLDVWSEGGRRSAREEMRAAGRPDLIVTLGGDGTFLRGARLAAKSDAPNAPAPQISLRIMVVSPLSERPMAL